LRLLFCFLFLCCHTAIKVSRSDRRGTSWPFPTATRAPQGILKVYIYITISVRYFRQIEIASSPLFYLPFSCHLFFIRFKWLSLSLSLSIVFLPSCYLCLFIIIFLNVRWGLCNFEGRRREQSRSSRPKLQQRETRADRAKGKKPEAEV